jgi:hypothetical protein
MARTTVRLGVYEAKGMHGKRSFCASSMISCPGFGNNEIGPRYDHGYGNETAMDA